jgi:hypothetical protein
MSMVELFKIEAEGDKSGVRGNKAEDEDLCSESRAQVF